MASALAFLRRPSAASASTLSPPAHSSYDPILHAQMQSQRLRFNLLLIGDPEGAKAVLDAANIAMKALGY